MFSYHSKTTVVKRKFGPDGKVIEEEITTTETPAGSADASKAADEASKEVDEMFKASDEFFGTVSGAFDKLFGRIFRRKK